MLVLLAVVWFTTAPAERPETDTSCSGALSVAAANFDANDALRSLPRPVRRRTS